MTKTNFRFRTFLMALAVAAGTAGAMAGPALADDWGHRGWDQRDRHDDRRRTQPHRIVYARPPAPAYAYGAPAYVYGAPAYGYAPPAAFTLVLPLNFQ
jgi:hypothetical protein